MAIVHNGNVAMWCYISNNKVEVFDCVEPVIDGSDESRFLWGDGYYNVYHESKLGEHVMTFRAEKIFIGHCDCSENDAHCGRMRKGHGLLCEMSDESYICISGTCIHRFKTRENEKIVSLVSRVGNNGVPYPYAVSGLYTYFLMDDEAIENSRIPADWYPYDWYYQEKEERKAAKPIRYDSETMYSIPD